MSVPILIYHGLYQRREELAGVTGPERRYYLSVAEFMSHMDVLSQGGYDVCSLSAYLSEPRPSADSKTVVLSFDDGHISSYKLIWPELRARRFGATFFIVPGWLGRPGTISEAQMIEMAASGACIGSHSMTHPRLSSLPAAAMREEMLGSRLRLEEALSAPVSYFAVPGGFSSPAVVAEAREAGYRAVCTSAPGLAARGFLLPRFSITAHTSPHHLAALAARRFSALLYARGKYATLKCVKTVIPVDAYERVVAALSNSHPGKGSQR